LICLWAANPALCHCSMEFHEYVAPASPRMTRRRNTSISRFLSDEELDSSCTCAPPCSCSRKLISRSFIAGAGCSNASNQEHSMLPVQRSLEEQGHKLDVLQREDASCVASLSLTSKSLEEHQSQTRRGAGMALGSTVQAEQLKSLEDDVDLVEALVRARGFTVRTMPSLKARALLSPRHWRGCGSLSKHNPPSSPTLPMPEGNAWQAKTGSLGPQMYFIGTPPVLPVPVWDPFCKLSSGLDSQSRQPAPCMRPSEHVLRVRWERR